MKKLNLHFTIFLSLAISACAAPEEWPTVSFGNDISATNDGLDARLEVSLAPLPSLLPEDTLRVENTAAYMNTINADYRTLLTNINKRFEDYSRARKSMTVETGEDFAESWLGAQMELSNISQYTEDLTKMRARITALGNPLPEAARVLLARIEAQELQNRLFIREEKLELARLEPS